MTFDEGLRRMLARREPPAGFVDRVLTSVGSGPVRANIPLRLRWRRSSRAGLAVAASLGLAIVSIRMWNEQQAMRRAERTQRDVEVALRLTTEKLNSIHLKLSAIGARKAASHDTERH